MTNTIATNAPAVMGKSLSALDTALASALTKAAESSGKMWDFSATAVGKAVDTVQSEAPLVISEFLRWKVIEQLMPMLGWAFCITLLICLYRITAKWVKSENYDPDASDGFDGFCGVAGRVIPLFVIMLIFCMSIVPRLTQVAKIGLAPRVYLIEYAVDTFKKK